MADAALALNGTALPPFYRRPVALCGDRHRSRGVMPDVRYGFMSENTALPLGVSEFALAMRHYPIVFTDAEESMPVAVTGLFNKQNLFVDAEGLWQPGAYVPGFLRRYPFILVPSIDGEAGTLVVDEASSSFVETSGNHRARRLFDDEGGATSVAEEALALCHAAHHEQFRNAAFLQALREARLLVSRNVRFQLQNGAPHSVDGFRIVDEQAFRALPRDVLEAWFPLGWIDAIVLHLASQQSWLLLGAMHDRHATPPAQWADAR